MKVNTKKKSSETKTKEEISDEEFLKKQTEKKDRWYMQSNIKAYTFLIDQHIVLKCEHCKDVRLEFGHEFNAHTFRNFDDRLYCPKCNICTDASLFIYRKLKS